MDTPGDYRQQSKCRAETNRVYSPDTATAKVPDPRTTRLYRWLADSWALEHAAVCLAFACLIGILTILVYFTGRPLSEWRSKLSISTMLSILATAMKGSVLLATASAMGQLKWGWYRNTSRPIQDFQTFDDASRGPLGAVILLLRLPPTALGFVAALITIISLGMDAFVQASASEELRIRFLQGAFVPVCHEYSMTTSGYDVDPLLKGTFYAGIFNAGSALIGPDERGIIGSNGNSFIGGSKPNISISAAISPICSTGNCTFPPYATLAVRHRCSDITEDVPTHYDNQTSIHTATFHTPGVNGTTLTATYPEFSNDGDITLLNMTSDPTTAGSLRNGSISSDILIADVYMLAGGSYSANLQYQALHCSLSLGVQIYMASVKNGIFAETSLSFVPSTWSVISDGQGDAKVDDTAWWTTTVVVSGKRRTIKMSVPVWLDLTKYLQSSPALFNGSVSEGENAYWTSDFVWAFYNNYNAAETMSSFETVDITFESIAASVTRYLRAATGGVAEGSAQKLEPYVKARFWFMLLPSIVVVMTAALVVQTDRLSRIRGVPSWRSNILAAMYSGIGEEPSGRGPAGGVADLGPPATIDRISRLEEWARSRQATLRSG